MQGSGVNGGYDDEHEQEDGVIWVRAGAPQRTPLSSLLPLHHLSREAEFQQASMSLQIPSRQIASIHESTHASIHEATHPVGRENDENMMCISDSSGKKN